MSLAVSSGGGGNPAEPANTELVELMTEDGVFLVTMDGNYLGTQG